MTADPKGTAQACRMYDALLRYYPIAFQQEYGDTLALQFRDEYREVLASGKPMFRFWIFILFDFMRSLLSEVLEEGVKMIKKNFFVFCAIATGIVTLFWSLWGINSTYKYLHYTLKIPSFFEDLSWFLLFALGSLTLAGITNVVHKNLLFRLPPILLLVGSVCFLPVPKKNSLVKGKGVGVAASAPDQGYG